MAPSRASEDVRDERRARRARTRCRSRRRRRRTPGRPGANAALHARAGRARSRSPSRAAPSRSRCTRAKSTSATSATAWLWIAASSSTPTPPLPPMPCTRPMPYACHGVRRGGTRRCAWSCANAPRRQRTSSHSASATITSPIVTSALCSTRAREVRLPEHDRHAEDEQRRRVAEAPGEAEPRRAAAAVRDERRHGGQVIGVARVAQAEQDRDDEDDQRASSPSEKCTSHSSRPNIRRPPSGGPARPWPRRRGR